MKRTGIVCALLIAGFAMAFAGGAGDRGGGEFPGGRPITMIVPWAPGGGSDIGARILLPYLERELGTTVNVINPTGATGWIGWERLLSDPANGHTIAMVNFPALFSGYLNPALGRTRTIHDFDLLANHVTDFSGLAIHIDETRFTDLESFIAFARNNPVSVTTTGVGTQQHILLLKLNAGLGLNITAVHGTGFADSYAALLGRHVDAVFGSVGELLVPERNQELRALVLFSDDTVPLMPHIRVWNHLGLGPEIVNSSQRAFAIRRGTPPEVVSVLAGALERAINSPTQVARMRELGLYVDFMGPEDFTRHIHAEESSIRSLAPLLGW